MHQALQDHTAASLLEAIRQGEGAAIEFKSSFQKEVIETLTAFANTQGGTVLMGVGDAGQIVGNANHQLTATEISDAHIKLINSSWDYHPDPEHPIASISVGISSLWLLAHQSSVLCLPSQGCKETARLKRIGWKPVVLTL